MQTLFGASLSEPRIQEKQGKFAVPMYVCECVCMYVAIRRPRDHHAACMRNAQSISFVTLNNAQ